MEDESEVKYLDNPDKSDNDEKGYRSLRLQNGFTALIISDSKSTENEECNRPFTTRDETKIAVCALCLNVGSFNDPPNAPGMAHFLEHVISMGSEKYPKVNEYTSFVMSRGGSVRADTGRERIIHHFQIHPDYLLPAMDRFAQLFAGPLMNEDIILQEREAIDNEFHIQSSSDNERLKTLFRLFPKDGHPAAKFSCGNSITLRQNITNNRLIAELKAFKGKYCSAHRMTLALQAALPLNVLEKYVKECFSHLPSNYFPPDDFTRFIGMDSFNNLALEKIYKIKSTNNATEIEFKWILTPSIDLYESKPLEYISWLINRESPGSLSCYLRNKKLCDRLSTRYEQYSIYSVITLNLVLSQNTNSSVKEILLSVFSYMNMLRLEGPRKRIFDEIQKIAADNFRYAEGDDAANNVQRLCYNMHLYPPALFMTGDILYFNYDPESIQKFLDQLIPENSYIVLLDEKFNEEEFDFMETWYHIKYAINDIPNDWIDSWSEVKRFEEFYLPQPNSFIATDFLLIDLPNSYVDRPTKISCNDVMEIWYKPDVHFRLPLCYVHLLLISAPYTETIESSVLQQLFKIIFHEFVLDQLYDAKCTGLEYNVTCCNNGLLIKVNGFSNKVPTLLKNIIEALARFIKVELQDLFNTVKSQMLKFYSSVIREPGILASETCSKFSDERTDFWTSAEKQSVLNSIKYTQFVTFSKQLIDGVYVRCLIQGNLTHEATIKMIHESVAPLRLIELLPSKLSEGRILKPRLQSKKICRMNNLNPKDVNSVLLNHYRIDNKSKLSQPVIHEFLEMIIQEPLFNQIRTKEQLGYNVFCSWDRSGFYIIVYSPANKFTTDYVDERIESFLKYFSSNLKRLSKEEFYFAKRMFIKSKRCGIINLKEETSKTWFELNTKCSIESEYSQQISLISNVSIDEFRQWYDYYFICAKNVKKLSVHVQGN